MPSIPDDNPVTWEKVELGRLLFHDTRMSGNQTQSCASCHDQSRAFTDGLDRAVGSTGEVHPRGSMSLTNVAYGTTFGWANHLLDALEKQAPVPMFGEMPVELGLSGLEEVLLDRLAAVPIYQKLFAEAFPNDPEPVNLGNLVKSVATYQRTLISDNAGFDRWFLGDDDAMSDSAIRGLNLFFEEQLECFHCHGGFNFSAALTENNEEDPERPFINNGLYNLRCSDFGLPRVDVVRDVNGVIVGSRSDFGCYPPTNTGLFEVSTVEEHMGAFKPPTLRNICETAPYMHDGSIATLEEVLDHYAAGGRNITEGPFAGDGSRNPLKGPFLVGFDITPQEKADVIEFLCSLTDEDFLDSARIADPFAGPPCPGDCNFDDSIAVNELITQVKRLARREHPRPLPGRRRRSQWPDRGQRDRPLDRYRLRRLLGLVIRARPICLAALLVSLAVSAAAAATLEDRLAASLRHRGLRGANLGALVTRADDSSVLFERSADKLLIPASNAKVLTALAVLAELGPAHRFATTIFANAPPDQGGAVDTLAVRGAGDPSLTSEQMWRLAADLRRAGLAEVRGDILLDDSLFDRHSWHPSWGKITSRAFHAPVSSLSANYGHFAVEVGPGSAGGAARVAIDPPLPYLRLVNRAQTNASAAKARPLNVARRAAGGIDEVVVSGSVVPGAAPRVFLRSVSDATLYAGNLMRAQLQSVGIAVGGTVRRSALPAEFAELLAFEGKTVGEIVRLYMKYSNNNIAESLIKTLGARASGKPGSWKNGVAALDAILTELGLDPAGFSLVDGSGLSRDNRVAPRTLVRALAVARASFAIAPELAAALPIAATDGTMKRRAGDAAGAARVKTGLLNRVTGLSGYAQSADGEELIFSVLANGYKNGDLEAMAALDTFVEVLTSSSTGSGQRKSEAP